MTNLGRLSDVELELMQTIWELATPVTVTQLLAIFEESKGWKNSTISTMLERIISKGFLRKYMVGKTNYYSVVATFEDYQKQEGRNILSSLFGGSVKNFMASLAEDGGMTDTEAKELQEWFASTVNANKKDGDVE